ncbi:MAG: hypothetical protein ACJ76T_15670 [Solirubrobacteraceae bacterium]
MGDATDPAVVARHLFEARFVHLWNVHEGGVSAMQGLIDTAAIQSAFA